MTQSARMSQKAISTCAVRAGASIPHLLARELCLHGLVKAQTTPANRLLCSTDPGGGGLVSTSREALLSGKLRLTGCPGLGEAF